MASEMMEALMALCQEKHIDELYLIDRLEQSLAKSYTEVLHLDWGARVTIDRATGKVYVYKPWTRRRASTPSSTRRT